MHTDNLLSTAKAKGASDLHLKVGSVPVLRIDGELYPQEDLAVITAEMMDTLFFEITTEKQREAFTANLEMDFAYQGTGIGRFRINISLQEGKKSIVCRPVKTDLPSMESLGLPPICKELASKNSGLVIVTGPTGCGKSTTLAAMMNHLNNTVKRKIITIEDPVEFIHQDNKCIFYQREVGRDTKSFNGALIHAMRQDPDVILVGETRDTDTVAAVITAAETGHLVLTTCHTPGAAESINRLIDVFPPYQQQQIRIELAAVLEGVIYQVLLPRTDCTGRVAAFEVMIASPAIKNLIREGKTHQMMNSIQTGSQQGMLSLNKSLAKLVESGIVSREAALASTYDTNELLEMLGGHHTKEQVGS